MENKRVILITDGDFVAKQVVEEIAKKIGGRCISRSAGNPTPFTGLELVELIKQTPYDPVLVMFDDNGIKQRGEGEKAMKYIANHPEITVLGAIAVASNTKFVNGTTIDYSVDNNGHLRKSGVNKDGYTLDGPLRVYGDTVDILDELKIPIIIGIGDIGKMQGKDNISKGAPVTLKAVNLILEKWGVQVEEKYDN